TAGIAWDQTDDARGNAASGSAALGANAPGGSPFGDGALASISQCVPVVEGLGYSLHAKVVSQAWGFQYFPTPHISVTFLGTDDCSGTALAKREQACLAPRGTPGWTTVATSFTAAPKGARTASIELSAGAGSGVHGSGISAYFDDVFFGNAPSLWNLF